MQSQQDTVDVLAKFHIHWIEVILIACLVYGIGFFSGSLVEDTLEKSHEHHSITISQGDCQQLP